MPSRRGAAEFQRRAQEADIKAAMAGEGSAERADWRHIASSWRLLAERMIAERTGGEVSQRSLAKKPFKKPMRYQQSFYNVH